LSLRVWEVACRADDLARTSLAKQVRIGEGWFAGRPWCNTAKQFAASLPTLSRPSSAISATARRVAQHQFREKVETWSARRDRGPS
jgi:hypothetical protein